ncbi:hypothetical protein AAIG39_25185 [Phytobacter palmae]|uniref:DUF2543 domain-containing protein n=1 Tax=Phytobacter palmae TaxID=1855371 RepID=A0ABU9VCX0_9ENTR
MPAIPEPEIDEVISEILNAYAIISRSRQYAGMAGVPLPLSLHDVERYLAYSSTLIDRDELIASVVALDDAWRERWAKEQERGKSVK